MKVIKFLEESTIDEFENWLKDVCIDNSFNNIESSKSFKTVIINDDLYEGEKNYYIIQDRDNIKDLHETFKSYIKYYKDSEQLLFQIEESTRLFIYSYKNQLIDCNHKDIYDFKSLMMDLIIKRLGITLIFLFFI